MKNKLLIIGCGYLGNQVAQAFLKPSWQVTALTRSPQHANEFSQLGISSVIGDVMSPASLKQLPTADVVLYAVGFDRTANFTMQQVYLEGLTNVLEQVEPQCGRFIYISSTSVYGQDAGEIVNETSVTEPVRENGKICLAAEQLVRNSFERNFNFTILRLAGIYGPERMLARIDQLRQQVPMSGSADSWLNLIHVADATEIVVKTAFFPTPQQLYLIADDLPVLRKDYYTFLAQLAEVPPPVFLGEQTGKTPGSNKRCDNALVKQHLQVELNFPNYQHGLRHAYQTTNKRAGE